VIPARYAFQDARTVRLVLCVMPVRHRSRVICAIPVRVVYQPVRAVLAVITVIHARAATVVIPVRVVLDVILATIARYVKLVMRKRNPNDVMLKL